jgi:hypothetical protein
MQIVRRAIKNISLYVSFLALIGFILLLKDPEFFLFSIQGQILKDSMTTFWFALVALFIYICFLLLVGGQIALNSRRYFSNTELQIVLLYLVSIVPPVIVSQYLVKQFIAHAVISITAYLVISRIFNTTVKKRIAMNLWKLLKGNRFLFSLADFLCELILFAAILLIVNSIPHYFLPSFNLDYLSSGWYARLFFALIFNCINYLSIEYIIFILKNEMQKPHIKYYFLYNNSNIKRLWYIVKVSLPMILKKIKFFLSWFISFIILFEMDNEIYQSIGYRISVQSDGRPVLGNNIFPVFIVVYFLLFLVNTFFDIIIDSHEKPEKEKKLSFTGNSNLLLTLGVIFSTLYIKNKKKILAAGGVMILLVVLSLYYAQFYIFLQHYGYDTSRRFSVNDVIEWSYMETAFDDKQLLESKLCIREEKGFFVYYSLAEFSIDTFDDEKKENISIKVIPTMHTNVYAPDNPEPEIRVITGKEIEERDKHLSFSSLKNVEFGHTLVVPRIFDSYIPFALERSGIGMDPNSPNKLFFPVFIYYVFYLCLLILLVFLAAIVMYAVVLHGKNNKIISAIGNWVKNLILATPFVIVLSFLSPFFPEGNTVSHINPLAAFLPVSNNFFLNSIVSYSSLALILLIYILPGMMDDIINFKKEIIHSSEIAYLNNIGMKKQDIFNCITKQYGITAIKRFFMENFLFICILEFFVAYCFSLPQFIDYFGTSSVLSFENIFTKVLRALMVSENVVLLHFALLVGMYGSIYFLMKRGKR